MNDPSLVNDRAKKIAYIHNLLRNNPNGADLVQGMSTQEITTEVLYEGSPSGVREAASMTIRQDGTMTRNGYLDNQPD